MDISTEVTFSIPDDELDALVAKARELDEDVNGVEEAGDYTPAQALQVAWHLDPEWVHKRLDGWGIERAADESGAMRPVWHK